MTIESDINTILTRIETAKQEVVKPLRELRDKYTEEGSDRKEAEKFVRKILNSENILGREDVKNLITSVALAHTIHVSVGDYGNGEELYLCDSYWSDHKRGDWVSSSEGC